MKKINIWCLVFVMSLTMLSCDDFLDRQPFASTTQDLIFTDVELTQNALNGAYDILGNTSRWYGRNYVIIGDLAADNTLVRPVNSGRFLEDYQYSKNKDNTQAGFWLDAYSTIARSNNLINALEGGSLDGVSNAPIDQFVAEALFLRALGHFDLCRMFAQDYGFTADASHPGVPYVTVTETFGQPARNTVKEVYDNALADLTKALSLIDDNYYTAGERPYRASTGAINALMARIYLYKGDWANAKSKAEEVINNGSYSLLTNGGYIAGWAAAENTESIFDVAILNTDFLGTDALGSMYDFEGYGDIAPTENLLETYELGDVRLGWFVVEPSNGEIYVNKYPGRGGTLGVDNTRILRLSDMYLISAEASARMGDIPAGNARLNDIRTRAGIPAISPVNAIDLLDEVAAERRREFAFEGHRWYDLRRNQKDIERGAGCTATGWCSIAYPNDQFAYPIPQTEMNANPNMVQNPGY